MGAVLRGARACVCGHTSLSQLPCYRILYLIHRLIEPIVLVLLYAFDDPSSSQPLNLVVAKLMDGWRGEISP